VGVIERVWPWDSQPTEVSRIDWSSPFASGLIACVSPELNYEHVSGRFGTVVNGNTPIVSRVGRGLQTNGTTQVAWLDLPQTIAATEWTLLSLGSYSSPQTSRRIFTLTDSTSTQTIVSVTSGQSNAARVRLWARNSGNGSGTSVDSTNDAWSDEPTVVAVRLTNANNQMQAFINGRLSPGVATMGGSQPWNLRRVSWGAANLGGGIIEYWGGRHFLSMGWSRFLSDAEIAEISANPWQIFAPRRIFVPFSAAPALPTLTALARTNPRRPRYLIG
jgi:hypothetical protein